jgi:small subunit ribosomal protein S9
VIRVNGKLLHEYFPAMYHRDFVVQPLFITERMRSFDVRAVVKGGGQSGQAGAIRMAVASALQNNNPNFRPVLKLAGYLERDARKVERKKTGLRKARKAEQWGKR